jgi:hypothetical protein
MASNPIVRRSRQSFLIGFIIALVIMAVVVALLFMKINSLNEEKESLLVNAAHEVTVYTLINDVKSGDEITEDMLTPKVIKTDMDVSSYLTPYDFGEDEETGEPLKYFTKIDAYEGTIMTREMLYAEGALTANDERLVEYNMVVLPSQLKNGDYIDIRIQFPGGQEYIVLPKKKVEQCTSDAIWLKVSELEILTMNSAIVDAYRVSGATLRARVYTDPGIQEAAIQNYAVSDEILTAINADKNILDEAISGLVAIWRVNSDSSSDGSDMRNQRNLIDSYTSTLTSEQKNALVEAGVNSEITDIATMRDEYVTALEGTGIVGTNY